MVFFIEKIFYYYVLFYDMCDDLVFFLVYFFSLFVEFYIFLYFKIKEEGYVFIRSKFFKSESFLEETFYFS